jgi:hypothetical protein
MECSFVYRSVISILFVFLTRAAGKPVFYTSACLLLGVDRAELDTQSLHNNKKRLAVELSYKVRGGGTGQSWTPRASTTTRSGWLLSSPTR